MSLLITSSQSKQNTNSIPIERPEQYTNHIRGSLTIPANSEIAVDSVKINHNPLFDFQDGACSMFWFGERLDKTLTNAIDEGTKYGLYGIVSRAHYFLTFLYQSKKRTDLAKQHLGKAINLFERNGAHVYLEEAKEMMNMLQ